MQLATVAKQLVKRLLTNACCLVVMYGLLAYAATPPQTFQGLPGTVVLGGGALLAGACTSGNVTITGAQVGQLVLVAAGADPQSLLTLGVSVYGYVSSANTVTVRVCAIAAATPNSVTYSVRVMQ